MQCCPKSIKTTLNRIFSCKMLSQEHQGKIEQDYLPVKFCPKSINTTLNTISSCAMFSGDSLTTLRKVFTCAMVTQEYKYNIEKDFFLNNVVPRVLRQHLTGFFPVQCFLETLGQNCAKFLPVPWCPKSTNTTLKRIFF